MYYENEETTILSSREFTPSIIYRLSTNRTIFSTIQYHFRRIRKRIRKIYQRRTTSN